MAKTKKSFMLAGGILAIITGVGLMIAAIALLAARSVIDADLIVKAANEIRSLSAADKADIIANADKIATALKAACVVCGIISVGLSIANLVLGVFVNKQANAQSDKRGIVIALLVIGVVSGSLLVTAFMIVALCLKFNKVPSDTPEVVTTEAK